MAKKISKIKKEESFSELEEKAKRLEALINLSNNLREMERRLPIPFNEFLYLAAKEPEYVFRDIFQLFHDMIHHYVPAGIDEYGEHPESVGFAEYDTSNLFINECDNPFFADRLFANRFLNIVKVFRKGTQNNYIYLFEGPPGSGKSTFLNNLLQKLEDYSKTTQGTTYKAYWRLDIKKLGGFQSFERRMRGVGEENGFNGNDDHNNHDNSVNHNGHVNNFKRMKYPEKYLEFSCPNHDHPILLIPKSFRKKFLDELIPDETFKEKLFNEKQYEWVLQDMPCSICSSIFKAALDELGDPLEVFNMLSARKNYFNRQFGEGISVFNPGDPLFRQYITNPTTQMMLNDLLKNDDVKFITSYLAKTNNGVLALMDIKETNVERLKTFHGIISDGVHKVELGEERIKTFFMGLVNPEDTKHYDQIKSFQDRIITVNIPYILDYRAEVAIYKEKFGEKINIKFLPRVLENLAKIIISTRLDKESAVIKKWLQSPEKYIKYTDKNFLLLKMDIYTGKIPTWLTEEDIKRFDKQMRKEMLAASEKEGCKGCSGRQSLFVFNSFFSKYSGNGKLITMDMVKQFFTKKDEAINKDIPDGFIDSLESLYDYNVLQEVKESIYYYNEEQISRDIRNYLFAINFEPGEKKKSEYTGDILEISEDYFKNFEAMFLGTTSLAMQRKSFREDVQKQYITKTLASEIRVDGKTITETEQFKLLFEKYTRNIKENALAPYHDNNTFRRCLGDYGTESFNAYEDRVKRDVKFLISNLINKFNYSEEGARQVSIYVLDKNLAKKY